MRLAKLIWLAATLPLAACLSTEETQDGDPRNARAELPLYGGAVVVRGPRGYCVDARSLRRQGNSNLVLLASCESLSGNLGISVEPALMVVSVRSRVPNRQQPSASAIAAGVAPIRALQAIDGDGISLVQLDAGGDLALPGGDPRYWRAGMIINDHLVSLAVYGRQGSAISGAQGKRLIIDLAESLREASPVRRYLPPEEKSPPAPDAPVTRDKTGLLSGLFPKSG